MKKLPFFKDLFWFFRHIHVPWFPGCMLTASFTFKIKELADKPSREQRTSWWNKPPCRRDRSIWQWPKQAGSSPPERNQRQVRGQSKHTLVSMAIYKILILLCNGKKKMNKAYLFYCIRKQNWFMINYEIVL